MSVDPQEITKARESGRFPSRVMFPLPGKYSVTIKENGDSEIVDINRGIVLIDTSWQCYDKEHLR